MKVIGWTSWQFEDAFDREYPVFHSKTLEEEQQIEKIIAQELRDKGYKFTGSTHQNSEFGVPILDNGMVCQYSQRGWGGVMVQAYPEEINNSDGFGYCKWAWVAPEEEILPKTEDYCSAKEYVNKNFTKEHLIDRITMDWCPRDFGIETEYSLSEGEKWCTDHYTGDCEKCWNSRIANQKLEDYD